jgi:DNA-binding IclR family transcriptional regulator
MVGLLDLFQDDANRWTAEQMHERLRYTRSTLYRYLKVLNNAELLTSSGDGFVLGPRIIELDYEIRRRDPLIVASVPIMAQLVSEIPSIALLCRRYRDKVLCIHKLADTKIEIRSTYERGRARPLFRGAASRIILANMTTPQLKRLFDTQSVEFKAAKLGSSFTDILATLKVIRQRGWDCTSGQVTPGITGIAAPIFDHNKNIVGSLSLSIHEKRVDASRRNLIAEKIVFSARVISQTKSEDRRN